MRILLVTEDVPATILGGAGQHAVVLGNALLDAGHEVHMLGYQREPGFIGNCGFRGPLVTTIDFARARWQEKRLGLFHPLARPHMARRIWQAMRELPGTWDVVHYHGHNPFLGTLVPASWNFVHTLHDQGAECITQSRLRGGELCRETRPQACAGCATAQPNAVQQWLSTQAVLALRRASLAAFKKHRAVFVSDFVRRRYFDNMGLAAPSVRGHVVHNFIDVHRLKAALSEPLPSWPGEPKRLRVFGAGRINRAKGFGTLLDNLEDDVLQRIQLVIAGDGPDLARLREQHSHRGVHFLGWSAAADVLRWTQAAQVCVVPSIWEEPCATTILEALALGRPVLALRRGGTPELMVHGEPGQLRLFDEMPGLVQALRSENFASVAMNDRAAVHQRLPELLAIYGSGLSSRLHGAAAAGVAEGVL